MAIPGRMELPMIPLQFEPVHEQGSIELPDEDFIALSNYDGYTGPRESEDLSTILNKIDGIDDADYSGHYGAYIFVRVEIADKGAALPKVFEAINAQLVLARAWKAPVERYLVADEGFKTGETVDDVSPSDLFEAAESAKHNADQDAVAYYGVTRVGPAADGVWMIRTDDLRD